MDNTEKSPVILSLCSGYAGLDIGLERVIGTFRVGAYVEIEAFAISNLVAKMEKGLLPVAPVWTNLKTFNAEPFRDRIDILTAGYPCQPWSSAGKRLGKEDPRHLYPYIQRIIKTIRPVYVFFENVEGHLSLGFAEVQASLRRMGYAVEAGIFSASEVGAPHQRKRLFILAHSRYLSGGRELQLMEWGESGNRESSQRGTEELADHNKQGLERLNGKCTTVQDGRMQANTRATHGANLWPSRPGEPQHEWEPPRVTRKTKPQMGGMPDGSADRMDYAKLLESYRNLCVSTDNRTDELRLLGNGVVPATAEKAFRTLFAKFGGGKSELAKSNSE